MRQNSYTRSAIFEGAGEVKFDRSIFDRTCGCYNVETGFFTAKVKGVYAFGFPKLMRIVNFSVFKAFSEPDASFWR